ncbi:MAG: methionine adenosyltransferase domain-containing protein [Alphaproteobacteria bacterium]|nr:methionine adenosyltransferase domain-containing protein [Alphaproteobacteria bacterium]MBR3913454.1 methionine adenosyltransferase domain-containing protein [Alphaproteobacteria bacterium]
MLKTAEFVSLGHPDKTADFITCVLLDTLLLQDKNLKYAVEVMIKDNTVVLGGEISGNIRTDNLTEIVKKALRTIGYDERYASLWGDKAINIHKINVINLIGVQSGEILQGVNQNGWGDQGVFAGYACQGPDNMPLELTLARHLNTALYETAKKSDTLGLDIKTQITLDETGHIHTAIVAIPMLEKTDLTDFIIQTLGQKPDKLIINGTGAYTVHSSIADCGITGRKLACDFYSLACPVGGGSPWTKDASKADLTLNLYARKLACQHLKDNDECFVYLSSCIGQAELPSAVIKTIKNGISEVQTINIDLIPSEIIRLVGLDKPIFAHLCQNGLLV